MFYALALNPATEHQICHAHFGAIDDAKPNCSVNPELVFAIEHVCVDIAALQEIAELVPGIPVPRKVHLIGTLRQFIDALDVAFTYGANCQPKIAVFQKRQVFALEVVLGLCAELLIAIE